MQHTKSQRPSVKDEQRDLSELVDPLGEPRRHARGHLRLLSNEGPDGAHESKRVAAAQVVEQDEAFMGALRVESSAAARPSLRRHALLPLAMLTCAALYYGAGFSLSVVVGVACVFLLAQSWVGPWIRSSRERLDRDLLLLSSKGRASELPARVNAAWGFVLFGPPGEVGERRGRALREAGAAVEAKLAYASALEGYGGAAPLSVVSGYGYAAYDAGDDATAIEVLRAALDAAPHLGELRVRLAHAIVRSGGDVKTAEALFGADAPERVLLRALGALHAGETSKAKKLFASADKSAPRAALLVADLEAALGPAKRSAPKGKLSA